MVWRRFTEGRMGALSARQYTEVQDAVRSLVSDLGVRSVAGLPPPVPMLVRIKGIYAESRVGEPNTVPGGEVIDATSYLFAQVHIRLSREPGTVEVAERAYGMKSRMVDGADEDRTAVAIDLRPFSNIPQGTLAFVHPAALDMGEDRNAVPRQQTLYVITAVLGEAQATAGVYTVLASSGAGMYSVRRADESAGDPLEMENLYETSDYYGALLAPQNPCATLVARALGSGDRVFAFPYGGRLVTCSPTAWTVECQPCGTNPGGALASTYDAAGAEATVAGIMLKGY